MNRRLLFGVSLAVASMCVSEAVYAAPTATLNPAHAMFARSKMVKFSLRNDGSRPVVLKVGEDSLTLEAGATKSLELPVGTRIVRQEASGNTQAGSLVTEVSKDLSGNTIAVRD